MARNQSNLKVTASDALEFDSVTSPQGRKPRTWLKLTFAITAFMGIGVSGWMLYGHNLMKIIAWEADAPPLVRAPEGVVKKKPKNPGGLQVPNRDKLVYNRLTDESEETTVAIERLLPRPEAPLSVLSKDVAKPTQGELSLTQAPKTLIGRETVNINPPETALIPALSDVKRAKPPLPAPTVKGTMSSIKEPSQSLKEQNFGDNTSPPPLTPSSEPVNPTSPFAAVTPEDGSPAGTERNRPIKLDKRIQKADTEQGIIPSSRVAAASSIYSSTQMTQVDKTSRRAASANSLSASNVGSNPSGGGSYRVQLAAARSPEAARNEWDRVRRKNLDLLGEFGLTITRVDLGPKKGVFFRLRVGPIQTNAHAQRLCRDLSKRRIGCLIVKPGT
ncbi:MAG: hypothetical protein CBB68_03250 [Rhodospirillaceae bacterium TMED8]|nr:hypothetical protein [Magnetovibrio sp.]OUT51906.1 MAG: hypothetical protein CBB68_03250 [Rhodospirillaceae bacterium TMED8]